MNTAFSLPADGNFTLPVRSDITHYQGVLTAPGDGVFTLSVHSPRPLRVWIGKHLVIDDGPQRGTTHLVRRLRVAVCIPITGGEHEVSI